MENFLGAKQKKGLSKTEKLFQRDLPQFLLEIVRQYFRVEVEGIENVPTKSGLLIPNHSGVTALDFVMIANEVSRRRKRVVRVLAHALWFVGPHIRILARRMGLEEANKDAGETLLKRKKLVLIFPEGEQGNFKPTAERYRLREFKRGFVRMAMASQAPIVPVVVIGAEETNINLSKINLTKYLKGIVIPIPLNVVPLPAQWKIIFLPPIRMDKYTKKDASNRKLVHKICDQVRDQIQERIDKELSERKWIYFPKGSRKQYKGKAKSSSTSAKPALEETTTRKKTVKKVAKKISKKTSKKTDKKVVKQKLASKNKKTKSKKSTTKSSKKSASLKKVKSKKKSKRKTIKKK